MKCSICELRCDVTETFFGRCGMYVLNETEIVPRFENQISSFTVGRIEDVPILHYYPGSLTLLAGTVSCNFDCPYCENSYIARESWEKLFRYQISPRELVQKARSLECMNIAFNVNEPAVSFPYFLETAATARSAGLHAGCATNGYFTREGIETLAENIDFANVSLKSISDDFYKKSCRVPGVAPVIRNIDILQQKGVHVEVTTPVTPDMNEEDIEKISGILGGISRDIPWHIFWLLPEYKMESDDHVPVERLLAMKEIAHSSLNHVFLGNLVGSEWLDTACPDCGSVIVKRLNAMGCGCQIVEDNLNGGLCPNCGSPVSLEGPLSLEFAAADDSATQSWKKDPLSLGLLDVHGYQKLFDFRTGERMEHPSPIISKVKKLISGRPYPGDQKPESDTWVTDLALEMMDIYQPELVVLDYAQAWFLAVNQPDGKKEAFDNIFSNVNRFLDSTGFEPMVVGTGGFETVERIIDLEKYFRTEEIILSSGKYAYFNRSSIKDLSQEILQELSDIWDLYTRDEFLAGLESSYSDDFAMYIHDFIAVAKPGVMFKGLSSFIRINDYTSSLDRYIPVYTTLDIPEDITRVVPVSCDAVRSGKKVALIIIEGAGLSSFPFTGTAKCRNHDGLYTYQMHEQYISLGTGTHYSSSDFRFPLGRDYWLRDYRPYPFSGRFHRFLQNTPQKRTSPLKSLSVGNRNIHTHVCLEADISLECYCCYQHNFGTMAVFHEEALT